ncbi:MAG: hypothetical protein FJ295_18210, partial [Planctomycetes bacterium]|nr:hypothetical protein [Planctomycetota bacterium]
SGGGLSGGGLSGGGSGGGLSGGGSGGGLSGGGSGGGSGGDLSGGDPAAFLIPEPSSLLIWCVMGGVGLFASRRKTRRTKTPQS